MRLKRGILKLIYIEKNNLFLGISSCIQNLNSEFHFVSIPNYLSYVIFGIITLFYILLTLFSMKANDIKKVEVIFDIRELK